MGRDVHCPLYAVCLSIEGVGETLSEVNSQDRKGGSFRFSARALAGESKLCGPRATVHGCSTFLLHFALRQL